MDYIRYVLTADVGTQHTHIAVLGVINNKHFDVLTKYSHETSSFLDITERINDVLRDAKNDHDANVTPRNPSPFPNSAEARTSPRNARRGGDA